jgi:hypothetical protein
MRQEAQSVDRVKQPGKLRRNDVRRGEILTAYGDRSDANYDRAG